MLALAASAAMVAPAMAGEWKPMKPVEMVIMAGEGGGADRIARLFQSIIQKGNRMLLVQSTEPFIGLPIPGAIYFIPAKILTSIGFKG